MSVIESTSVAREVEIAARPETVWKLLTDPNDYVRWMGSRATLEVRPGGKYHVDVVPGHVASGKFVEVDPPRKLVFTWGWEGSAGVPPGSSTITFELIPRGKGTLLRFTHRDLPDASAVASHAEGWDHYFDRLATVASGGNPGIDPWMEQKGSK
ncbi:MAG TPA: SRPBCC domain-containing protein [Thermoanaerobaculia bacterium]|nr:SRPBCC domain-containing protein [Thermoanaerobaculia bacterium]